MPLPTQPSNAKAPRNATVAAATLIWGGMLAAGAAFGWWYESTPAAAHVVAAGWPEESVCGLAESRPTLLMFVHPRCPCSRSSVSELAVLMTRCQNRVDAQVLFFSPSSSPRDWGKTDLWDSAMRIPGVAPRLDFDGEEHRRFGARNSGEVFLFTPSGELAFHGGITAARGHSGDNVGRSAIESILLNGAPIVDTAPVFGCELNCPTPQVSQIRRPVNQMKDER